MARVQNIVFDFDGTLFDSYPSIEASAALAVARVMPGVCLPDLRPVIGPPIAKMFAMLWPDLPAETMAALLAEFRAVYDAGGCLKAEPYPGVHETLAALRAKGLRLFVLTNKPEKPTRAILAHQKLLGYFEAVHCPDSAHPFARKPEGAEKLTALWCLAPEHTALVGDGADDCESARRCGFHFWHASYGYGSPAATSQAKRLEKFADLDKILREPHPHHDPA
jgi:phosphoglycolate phosphatase